MESKESSARLSLIDVLYGVVLGYGFSYFDRADSFTDHFRFFFAYVVIIIDWIFVHRLYWGKEYKFNSVLILDIAVVFIISRLLHTATNDSQSYILWLSMLFLIYVVWDIVSRKLKLQAEYAWRYALVGDIFGTISLFSLWLLNSIGYISKIEVLDISIFIIYFIAFSSWLKKTKQAVASLS